MNWNVPWVHCPGPERALLIGQEGLEVIAAAPPLACLQASPSDPLGIRSLWRSRTSKPGWRLMSRGLLRQEAAALSPACDLWSCWHWVPGEGQASRRSGAPGSCAFLRPGVTGSWWLGPRPFGVRPDPLLLWLRLSARASCFLWEPQATRLAVPGLGQRQGCASPRLLWLALGCGS